MKVLGSKSPFYVSGIIHLIFISAIVISSLFSWINKDLEPQPLTLVKLPNEERPPSNPNTSKNPENYGKNTSPPLHFESQLPVEITSLPLTQKPTHKLVPNTKIKPSQEPKISREEFDRKHRMVKTPVPSNKIIKIPPIKINNEYKETDNQKRALTDQTLKSLEHEYRKKNLYKKQLSLYLVQQWEQWVPSGSSGLYCEITFKLSNLGKIYDLIIVVSSQNKDFDQSVILMFNRISRFTPPPESLKEEVFSQRFHSL